MTGFNTVLETMMLLFTISIVGWLCVRFRIINNAGLDGLTRVLIDVVTPAKLIVDITANLRNVTATDSLFVISVILLMCLSGILFGNIMIRFWKGKKKAENNAIVVSTGLSNGIFMPLPLLLVLVPAQTEGLVTYYIGMSYLVMTVLQWTAVVMILKSSGSSGKGQGILTFLKSMINIPVLAIFAGIGLGLVPALADAAAGESPYRYLEIPFEAASFLGTAISPLAMLVLGMLIGKTEFSKRFSWRSVLIPGCFRLIISPFIMAVFLIVSGISQQNPTMALTLIVLSSMPPATALSILARRFGGDWQTISVILLLTYLAALVTVPFWTSLFV